MPRWIDAIQAEQEKGCTIPGGAEDGDAAGDAEPRVPGVLGHLLAALDSDGDDGIAGHAMPHGNRLHRFAHQPPWHGIDRRLADGNGQARLGDRADAAARAEAHAATRRPAPQLRQDQRAMGHVGIVARVLDDARACHAVAQRLAGQGKARRFALGQGDGHGIGELAGQERGIGRRRGGGGAGAGGPAAAQVLSLGLAGALAHGAIVGVDVLKWLVSDDGVGESWLPRYIG